MILQRGDKIHISVPIQNKSEIPEVRKYFNSIYGEQGVFIVGFSFLTTRDPVQPKVIAVFRNP